MNTVIDEKNFGLRTSTHNLKWVRSEDGWFAGVCEGLGNNFGINPNLLRLGWLISIFAFGTGILFYIFMAIALPKDTDADPFDERILGVCGRLSQRTGIEVGVVRLLALFLILGSAGFALIAYVVGYFLLPENN